MRKSCLSIAWLVLIFEPMLASENAQENRRSDDVTVENVEVIMSLERIQVSFLVRDSAGNLIRDLLVDDFQVLENGTAREIVVLRQQEVPISAVVMVDTSWSLGGFLENAVNTARDFFQGLERERSAFVLFSEKPRVLLDWEEKSTDLSSLLARVKRDGKTGLYDSVIWVAEKQFRRVSGKKLIILITDGIDTVSRKTFEDMMDATRKAGITLYPIIYTNHALSSYRQFLSGPSSRRPKSVSSNLHNFMVRQNQFIDQTLRFGGRTIFSNGFADLRKIYADIISEMKTHYILLYESASERFKDNRKVNVNTRRTHGKIFIEISQ